MGAGIDPKVDYAFKRVYGSEENINVLQHFLNAFLRDSLPRPIVSLTLLNPFCLTDFSDDKLTILDIKARDDVGREYIIEVQLYVHANLPERLLYYAAKEYSGQLSVGDPYSALRPVIVLCFVDDVLFRAGREFHSRFELRDPRQDLQFSDHLQIHLIELPKFLRTLTELRNDSDRWTYFLQHGCEFDTTTLPSPLATVPEIQQATGTLTMVSQTPAERERYEAQLKFARDQQALLEEGTRRGLEEGTRRGFEAGSRRGLESVRNMVERIGRKRFGEPPAAIVNAIASMTEIDQLQELADRALDCASWDALLLPKENGS